MGTLTKVILAALGIGAIAVVASKSGARGATRFVCIPGQETGRHIDADGFEWAWGYYLEGETISVRVVDPRKSGSDAVQVLGDVEDLSLVCEVARKWLIDKGIAR